MNIIDRLFGRESRSGQQAKERLQLVLVHDRSNLSPAMMDLLKDELISTLERHLSIEREGVEMHLTQTRRETRLVADIPLKAQRKSRKDEPLSDA
jgi:cell division topological specificity factor